MNGRKALVTLGLVVAAALGALTARPATAALRDVRVGNFYYDDATAGDGKIEVDQGDQLRFTVLDGGPGTPHTVEIDEFGIHSGGLASGETYTTPPLDRAGTFRLYCKPHQVRGHQTTLIVRASGVPTTTSPPTTAPPAGSPTTSTPVTTTPASGPSATTTTPPNPGATTDTTATGGPPPGGPSNDSPAAGSAAGSDTTLAPVGRGEADPAALAGAPVDPDSLQATVGRPVARKGPWTRSVRLGLIVLVAMAAAAGAAAFRGRRA